MQQNVQKSSRTILPRRSPMLSAFPPVFSHSRPRSSGARRAVCDSPGVGRQVV